MYPQQRIRVCRKKPQKRVKKVIRPRRKKAVKAVKSTKKLDRTQPYKSSKSTKKLDRSQPYKSSRSSPKSVLKTIHFDPRGDHAKTYKSFAQSRDTRYCNMSHHTLMDLGHTMGISYELDRAANNRGKKNFCEVLTEYFPVNCLKGWRITNFLGAGTFGFVFSIRSGTSRRGALKVVKDEANFSVAKEIAMQKRFHKLGMSPPVIDHCSYTPKGGERVHFILMERIDGVIDSFLQKRAPSNLLDTMVDRLFQIIQKMEKENLTHGDFHTENIGFVYKRANTPGNIQIIDHGMSSDKGSNPELEVVQFLRTIESRYSPRMDSQNRKLVKARVHKLACEKFGLKIPKTLNALESRFVNLRRKLYILRK